MSVSLPFSCLNSGFVRSFPQTEMTALDHARARGNSGSIIDLLKVQKKLSKRASVILFTFIFLQQFGSGY
jgi:hypothetical protein